MPGMATRSRNSWVVSSMIGPIAENGSPDMIGPDRSFSDSLVRGGDDRGVGVGGAGQVEQSGVGREDVVPADAGDAGGLVGQLHQRRQRRRELPAALDANGPRSLGQDEARPG